MSILHGISLTILLVSCIAGAQSNTASVTDGGLKRRGVGESCRFQWIVTGTFISYTVNSLANGNLTPLGFNTNHTSDQSKGVITLFIWNIQLSDAGFYQLTLLTGSSASLHIYSIGTLFVYAVPYSSVTLISGTNPAQEGDNIQLNCTVTSYSLPVANQPKLYYFWTINNVSFQNVSSGQAIKMNGDVLPQYQITNDGGTLVITSAQAFDNHIYCQAQEEGSPYKSIYSDHLPFQLYYRPYTYSLNPPSMKITDNPYNGTVTVFSYSANPPSISYTNWSFTSSTGGIYEIPVNDTTINNGYFTLSLNSTNFYGNYSITLTNFFGSRTETFRVIHTGPPDAPSQFSVQYVTHSILSLQWRCMWNNGFSQTVFVRLIEVASNTEIGTQAISPNTDCFDILFSTTFQRKLLPYTLYQVIIWSSNQLGSSNSQTLNVRTQVSPVLNVSCQNISITGSQAFINVSTFYADMVWLNVTCCVESTVECITQSYTLLTPVNQIVMDDILPVTEDYVFDFVLFDGNFYNYIYLLAAVKDVHVSRTSFCNLTCNDQTNPNGDSFTSTTTNIVLGVLLGVALVAFGICLGILIWRIRHQEPEAHATESDPRNNPKTLPTPSGKSYGRSHRYTDQNEDSSGSSRTQPKPQMTQLNSTNNPRNEEKTLADVHTDNPEDESQADSDLGYADPEPSESGSHENVIDQNSDSSERSWSQSGTDITELDSMDNRIEEQPQDHTIEPEVHATPSDSRNNLQTGQGPSGSRPVGSHRPTNVNDENRPSVPRRQARNESVDALSNFDIYQNYPETISLSSSNIQAESDF